MNNFITTLKRKLTPSLSFMKIDVTKRDPFAELVVLHSDTDVFLLLLHRFDKGQYDSQDN